MHRFQISVFGAIAIVFAVDGVNQGIYDPHASLNAMAAGWLILAIVNILWTLYFTSEEDSLAFHLFNSMGTGGLTPPSRRRRTRTTSMHNIGTGNGYSAGYSATPGGMVGTGAYDTKMASSIGGPIGSGASFRGGSAEGPPRSLAGTGSIHNPTTPGGPGSIGGGGVDATSNTGVGSPLMGGAAGVGAGGGGALPGGPSPQGSPVGPGSPQEGGVPGESYRAKALYACELSIHRQEE